MKNRKSSRSQLKVLGRLLIYIRHYWWFLLISLVLAAITVISTLYIPILTGNAVDLVIGAGQVDLDGVIRICTTIAIVVGITALSQWIMTLCNNKLTYCVVRDMRKDAFNHINRLPLSYIDSHPHGDIVSRVIADADQMGDGLLMGLTQLFSGLLTIACTLYFMVRIHPFVAVVVVCITPLSFVVAGFIAKKTYDMFRLQSKYRGEQTAFINEMVDGQRVVRAFGVEKSVMQKFDGMNERLASASFRATFFSSITNPSTRFVNSVVYAGVCLSGALLALGGGFSIGNLVSFLSYANQYTKPFNEISGVITELQNAIACAERILELIENTPVVTDAPNADALTAPDGSVNLENVSFSYNPEKPLITDFNLRVRPAQRIAIVGPTGCGKTTLINLLMRFYDVDSGTISVSGHDIRSISRESLRSAYGMVLQETWLKNGTVRENIAFGAEDCSEDDVIRAAKAAHAHGFISRLPKGYDTVIGDDIGNLSQGQRQLLCISRVMLRLPSMLILDEATSSIDLMTEQRIQKAFLTLMEGRTTFVVAHRLSTIRTSDVILVMKDGHIIEQGNHEELLSRNGFYAELYTSQFIHEPDMAG